MAPLEMNARHRSNNLEKASTWRYTNDQIREQPGVLRKPRKPLRSEDLKKRQTFQEKCRNTRMRETIYREINANKLLELELS